MNRGRIDGFAAGFNRPWQGLRVPELDDILRGPDRRAGGGSSAMAGLAILLGVVSTRGRQSGPAVSGLSSPSISKGIFHSHGTISPETGETGHPARACHAIGDPDRIARRPDGAGQPFAGPALVALGLFDIGHQGAEPGLGLVGELGLERLAGHVPALGGDGGAGQGVGTFEAAGAPSPDRAPARSGLPGRRRVSRGPDLGQIGMGRRLQVSRITCWPCAVTLARR